MAEQNDQNRDARDLGSRSPASEEAQQQNASGQRGGPRAEQTPAETQDQVAQTSGRRGAQHRDPASERKSFAPGQAPSEQGEQGSPSPEQIAKNQQGIGGQGGAHGAHGDQSQGVAQRGEPYGDHTRNGRETMPGDRERE